jgi:hypothetical protein
MCVQIRSEKLCTTTHTTLDGTRVHTDRLRVRSMHMYASRVRESMNVHTDRFRVNVGIRTDKPFRTVAYPGIFFRGGGGGSTNSVKDRGQRERGSGDVAPLVRGSGGSRNLVQEISFHIVKFS